MTYRDDAAPDEAWTKLFVPEEGSFRWSRAAPFASNGERHLIGFLLVVILLVPASVPRVFCTWSLHDLLPWYVALAVPGFITWVVPIAPLLLSRERLQGMRFMARTVAIDESVAIDDHVIGPARDVRACCFQFTSVEPSGMQGTLEAERLKWSVALMRGQTIYELARTSDEEAARAAVERLRAALGGEQGEAIAREVGSEPFVGDTRLGPSGTLLLAYIPIFLTWFTHGHPPIWLAWLTCALLFLARASIEVVWLSQSAAVDPARFGTAFAGAVPVRPTLWLTEPRARRLRLAAHVLLLAAVLLGAFLRA